MRSGSYVPALVLMAVLDVLCAPVSAQPYSQHGSGTQVDVSLFYDGLAPYGDWVEMPEHGWSFAPHVDRGWRPYTRGQWIMTDDGWYWDSDERFGWATYHYGRWADDPRYGWVWIPGSEWAPAWVSWRHGNGYTGWAPLPPRATWQSHVGLNIGGLDIDAFIGARDYAFVQDRSFVDRGVYQRVLPPAQNVTIINVTNNVTNYTVVNQRVVNGGIDVVNVERAAGRHVPRARTVEVDRADGPRRARADEIAVFRPEVKDAPGKRPAQGRSLVRGEAPPPVLEARGKAREQERQQKGKEAEVTAKDAQRRPAAQLEEKKANGAVQPTAPRTGAKTRPQAQRQGDEERANQARAKRDSDVQARGEKPVAQERPAGQPQAKKANAGRGEAPPANGKTQQQAAKRQRDQQQADPKPAKRDGDVQAKNEKPVAQDRSAGQPQEKKPNSAGQQQTQRSDPQTRPQGEQAQPAKRGKQAPLEARDDPKDKGKKKPKASPEPPPAEQHP
jgi:Family of unknown function (DUF6600)